MPLTSLIYGCEGVRLSGVLAAPEGGGNGSGVLVAHEAPGLNAHIRARAESLSALGYVAFALDLYGEAFPLEETLARHHVMISTPGLIHRRARAALEVLATHPDVDPDRIGGVGFCQGGVTVMELARGGDLACAIGLHPSLARPAGSPECAIRASVLMLLGDADPIVSGTDREAFAADMTARGVDWQMHVFGGVGHSFTDPAVDALSRPGFAYDSTAERRAWALTLSHLHERLRQRII